MNINEKRMIPLLQYTIASKTCVWWRNICHNVSDLLLKSWSLQIMWTRRLTVSGMSHHVSTWLFYVTYQIPLLRWKFIPGGELHVAASLHWNVSSLHADLLYLLLRPVNLKWQVHKCYYTMISLVDTTSKGVYVWGSRTSHLLECKQIKGHATD